MKKLTFLKEYQQFREDFEFNDAGEEQTDIIPGAPEGLEEIGGDDQEDGQEQTESSCQDRLGDAIDNLQVAIQDCMGGEAEETQEEEEQFESFEGEEGEESHEGREMEIYGRMKEIADELQGLMSELKGEEASEESQEESEEGDEDFENMGGGQEESQEEESDEA